MTNKNTFCGTRYLPHCCSSYCCRGVNHQMFRVSTLDLSRSRVVIGHVNIRLVLCSFLYVFYWHRPAVLACSRDIKPQIYQGRDLDLEAYVTSSVTWVHDIQFPIGALLELIQIWSP